MKQNIKFLEDLNKHLNLDKKELEKEIKNKDIIINHLLEIIRLRDEKIIMLLLKKI